MTDYTINGNVVQKIQITLPDGKVVTIIPHDEDVHEDEILLPIRSQSGEFTHDLNIIGRRGIDNVFLAVDEPQKDHIVGYTPKGEGNPQPLIHIHGERANG